MKVGILFISFLVISIYADDCPSDVDGWDLKIDVLEGLTGCCTKEISSTCSLDCATKSCSEHGWNFITLDFTKNPYTCCPIETIELLARHKDATKQELMFSANMLKTGIENKDKPDANTYSKIGTITTPSYYLFDDNHYKFLLQYITLKNVHYNIIWKQKSWITKKGKIEDYNAVKVPPEPNVHKGQSSFDGLGKSNDYRAYLDGNGDNHFWWWNAVGTNTIYGGGIPSFNQEIAKSMALYIYVPENKWRYCGIDATETDEDCIIPGFIKSGYIAHGTYYKWVLTPFTNDNDNDLKIKCGHQLGIFDNSNHLCSYIKSDIVKDDFVNDMYYNVEHTADKCGKSVCCGIGCCGWTGIHLSRYGSNNKYIYKPFSYTHSLSSCGYGDLIETETNIIQLSYIIPNKFKLLDWTFCGNDNDKCTGLNLGNIYWLKYGNSDNGGTYFYQLIKAYRNVECNSQLFQANANYAITGNKKCYRSQPIMQNDVFKLDPPPPQSDLLFEDKADTCMTQREEQKEQSDTSNPWIIIDNGGCDIKVGYAGTDAPCATIPNVIGYLNAPGLGLIHSYVGNDALNGPASEIISPMKNGIISHWDDMENVWRYILYDTLKIDPKSSINVMLTDKPSNPLENREKITQTIFEKFNGMKYYLARDARLALFLSHISSQTGLVIDCGCTSCEIVPYIDGYIMSDSIFQLNLGGYHITEYLMTKLQVYSLALLNNKQVVNDIKEKLCYVASDFSLEKKKPDLEIEKEYVLPDTRIITLRDVLFESTEILFQPNFYGSEEEGIHKLVHKSMMSLDADIRKEIYSNIVITGGTTLLKGFVERLEKEIKLLAEDPNIIKIVAPSHRKIGAWIGSSILASVSGFAEMWITKEEYDTSGPSIVNRKSFAHKETINKISNDINDMDDNVDKTEDNYLKINESIIIIGIIFIGLVIYKCIKNGLYLIKNQNNDIVTFTDDEI